MSNDRRNAMAEDVVRDSGVLTARGVEAASGAAAVSARPPMEWVGPTPNRTPEPVAEPRRIAIHSMAGFWAGSISWNKRPDVEAAAHFYIRSSDGHIGQLVSEKEQAWGSFWLKNPDTGEGVPEPHRGYHFFHIEHDYAPRHDYHVLLRDSFLKPIGAWE